MILPRKLCPLMPSAGNNNGGVRLGRELRAWPSLHGSIDGTPRMGDASEAVTGGEGVKEQPCDQLCFLFQNHRELGEITVWPPREQRLLGFVLLSFLSRPIHSSPRTRCGLGFLWPPSISIIHTHPLPPSPSTVRLPPLARDSVSFLSSLALAPH